MHQEQERSSLTERRPHGAEVPAPLAEASSRVRDERRMPNSNVRVMRNVGNLIGGRYLLKTHVGARRDGDVYEAVDDSLSDAFVQTERRVLVHVLNARAAQLTRLLQALETSYLQPHSWAHPNVLKILGFGNDQGEYFFVTEAFEGATLRTILDETLPELLSEEEALGVLSGVGNALKYAHAKRVVHGDLRPENIFVTNDLVVKVLDLLPASLPRIMPLFPEDNSANGAAVPDPRDDVYGLACLAYELFAGRHPFNGNSALEALTAGLALAPIPRLGGQRWEALAQGLTLRRERRAANVGAFLTDIGVTGHARLRRGSGTSETPLAPAHAPAPVNAPADSPASWPNIIETAPAEVLPRAETRPRPRANAPQPRANAPRPMHAVRARTDERPQDNARSRPTWIVAIAASIVAAGAVYWKYDWLQTRAPEWLAMGRSVVDATRAGLNKPRDIEHAATAASIESTNTAPPLEVADSAAVAPSPVPAPESVRAAAPAAAPSVAAPGTRVEPKLAPPRDEAPAAQPAAASPEPGPETFEAEHSVVVVSESAASAAITVHRHGGGGGSSSFVWWTSDGTAVANEDYVDLGAKVEKMAPGEESRTIYIPIVHDSTPEHQESFYVNLRAGREGKPLESTQRVEVVIVDDD
jgi:serine/threonine protein kinase